MREFALLPGRIRPVFENTGSERRKSCKCLTTRMSKPLTRARSFDIEALSEPVFRGSLKGRRIHE